MNVFDFDNTIYRGESTLDLFFFYLVRKPWMLRMLPTVLKAFARYKKGEVTLGEALEVYAPMIEKDALRVFDFDNDPKAFWDRHMRKIKPLYSELRSEDDLIITASPDFSIEEVCRRLGIKRFLASRINRETGRIEHANLRENKIKAFLAAYGDCEIERFYTDSPENDAVLVERAQQAFLVKGNKVTRIK